MYNIIQLIYGVLFFVKTAHANTVSASSDCDDCEGTVYNLLAGCPEFAQDSAYQAQENRGIGAFSGDGLSGCCGGSINMAISGGDILAVQRSGDQTGSCFTFKVQQAGQIPYNIEVPDDCDDCSVTVYHIVGDPPNYNGRSWTDSSIWAGIGESTSPSSPLSGEWSNVGKSGIFDVAQGDNIGLCGHRNSGSSIHAFKITQIGCFIGSTEPITPPPRPAAPLQPFVFPDNPTQRDVCRELTDADACLANHECSWNVFQGMCNEFGHQPLFGSCTECSYVRTTTPPPTTTDEAWCDEMDYTFKHEPPIYNGGYHHTNLQSSGNSGWIAPDRQGTQYAQGGDPTFFFILDVGQDYNGFNIDIENMSGWGNAYLVRDFEISVSTESSPDDFTIAQEGTLADGHNKYETTVAGRYIKFLAKTYGDYSAALSHFVVHKPSCDF